MFLCGINYKKLWGTLLILIVANTVVAQTILVGNPLRSKRFVFHSGDFISFKVKESKHLFKGNIQGLYPKHLMLNSQVFEYKSIKKLVFPDRLKFLRFMGYTLMGSTAISFTISGLTRLTDGQSFSDKDQWILFGILTGVGVVFTPFKDRHYYLHGGRKIRYTDL